MPEEIAYRAGWITAESLAEQGARLKKTAYGQYLLQQLDEIAR